ncbi:tetratricopeptide repeat protein [Myxococcus xanthus]|uniref:Tetratricopeptide repeat protein n=1 Tax=Myxococcus xanthus TaxID=34 RepID=A0A7Y4IG27_MYXXA|nr:tetratricopeptide repeat protein [Myxococcus xanthus]NOJ78618.1 tetratricopeptide repeat protein [Myxococcus xanthus]NOJ86458.1 tetratricopeptide repeat protein [Myxococcus xanthus]
MDKNKIIEAAAKLVAKGAYDKAIKEYQKVLEVDPKDIRVLQKMGELYQKKNDNPQAAHFFTKVAESYSSDGFFLKAVALYKQVLKLNPNLLEVNLKLAELHQQLGLMSEAMAYFQIVANHYDKAGDTKSSLDTLKKMVDLDPENVASKIKLAELYARENMPREAAQEFKRAAEYLKRNSRADDWLRVAERLSALEPDNLPLSKELATSYLQRGDQKRALAKLQVCFKADGRDVETLTLLAQAFQGLGQTSKTISVYKELAKIHQERGRVTEAEAVWTQIEVLDPEDPDLVARRAPEPAAPQPTAAPQPAPRPAPQPAAAAPAPVAPPAPAGMGREQLSKLLTETDVYVKYGLHDKALEHLRKVFSVEPENLDAHEKAYQIYVASGNMAQASEQLLNVLRLCTRTADVQRAQPYLATILQENPAHPEVPAFLSVLRTTGPVVAAPTVTVVESVGEDAILVDSSDDEILVAPPPEDALLHPPGDELALTTLPSSDSDEVIEEDSDSAVISEEALVGEAITSGEFEVYGTPDPEDLAAASVDETLVTDDDPLVLSDEPGLSVTDDEPLIASSDDDDDLAAAAAYSLNDESLVDDGAATSMEALSLGDDDEPQPTQMHAPTQALLDEASPDTLQVPALDSLDVPALDDEAPPPLDLENVPTRVGAAPLTAADLDEDPFGAPALGDPMEFEEPTASHAIVAMDDESFVEDAPELSADELSEPVAYEEPAVEPEPEPEVEAAADEEEPAAEECDEASFFLDQGLLEEAREILETVMIAFPGHARAAELMERLEAAEAGGGAEQEDAAAEPAQIPSVQPVTDGYEDAEETTGERDAFDLAAELAGEIDNFGDDAGASALPAEEDFQYSVEEVFSEFKKSLAKVVKPEDVDTHYDLGIAYKEMGLLDDALHEFEVARQGSAGGKRELDCITMMGMLQLLRGDASAAVEAFREGLGNPHATGEAAKALGFELAAAYEAQGDAGKALFHYQRVAGMDGKYRDVAGHVSRLAASVAPVEDPLPTPSGNGAQATSSPPAPAGAAAPTTPIPAAGASKARKVGYL